MFSLVKQNLGVRFKSKVITPHNVDVASNVVVSQRDSNTIINSANMIISSDNNNNSYVVCDGCWLSFQQVPNTSNNKNLCTSCEQEQNNGDTSDDNDTHVSKSYDITDVLESNSNDSDDDNSDLSIEDSTTSDDDEPQIDIIKSGELSKSEHGSLVEEKSTSSYATIVNSTKLITTVNKNENSYAVCDGYWLSFEQLSSTKLCISCEQNDNVLCLDVSKSRDNVTCDDEGAKTNSVSCGISIGKDDIVEDIDMPETCANCGKEADEGCNLNSCNRCKLVKYCNAACKKKHRSKHKKKCDRRASELHDEKLFKEHPPNEECPICLIPMPHEEGSVIFRSCCGKTFCHGCAFGMGNTELSKMKIDEMVYSKEKMESPCPYCRTHLADGVKQFIKQTEVLAKNGNAEAYYNLGIKYAKGKSVAKDYTKANAWWLKGGQLGCAAAYNNLGTSYLKGLGVERDEKKAKYYFELGALGGSVPARHNLGTAELKDEESRAVKHFLLAARAGYKPSLDFVLKYGFRKGVVTKDEYANTLRAYQERHDLMKSNERTKGDDFKEVLGLCLQDPFVKSLFKGRSLDLFGLCSGVKGDA